MFSIKEKSVAIIYLFSAAVIWGLAFIAIKFALDSFQPLSIITIRFILAFAVAGAFAFLYKKIRGDFFLLKQLKISFLAGVALSIALTLQVFGIRYTTVSNSAFITTTYVAFVPLIEGLFFKKRIGLIHWLCVLTSLIGMVFISKFKSLENIGDMLTLCCAIASAFHIVAIEVASREIKSAFVFNSYQSLWAGLFACPLAFSYDSIQPPVSSIAIVGVLFLSLVSTSLGFMLQVKGQMRISPSVASLILLLESPFGAIFAWIFFRETLSPSQWFGAVLIFGSVVLNIISGSKN